MKEAVRETNADASVIYVPAPFVLDSIVEAVDSGVGLIVVITEGVPTIDMLKAKRYLETNGNGTRLVGPNCPGVITPVNVRLVLCLVIFTNQAVLVSSRVQVH